MRSVESKKKKTYLWPYSQYPKKTSPALPGYGAHHLTKCKCYMVYEKFRPVRWKFKTHYCILALSSQYFFYHPISHLHLKRTFVTGLNSTRFLAYSYQLVLYNKFLSGILLDISITDVYLKVFVFVLEDIKKLYSDFISCVSLNSASHIYL